MTPPKRFIFCKPFKDCVRGEVHRIVSYSNTKKFSLTEDIEYEATTRSSSLNATWDLALLKKLLDSKIIIPF